MAGFDLDLYDNREHHRAAFCFLKQEKPNLIADLVLEVCVIDVFAMSSTVLNNETNLFADGHQEVLVVFEVNKATRDNIWAATNLASLVIHQSNYNDKAVFRENLSIS